MSSMLNKLIFLGLAIIILSVIVQAENSIIESDRTTYNPGETVKSKINLNIQLSKGLQNSDFRLIDSQNNNVPISISKTKINSTLYYVSFDIPSINPGNYEFGLYDIFYNDNGISKKITIKNNLVINNEVNDILSIKPSYYFKSLTENEESPFSITLKNNGVNEIELTIFTQNNFLKLKQNKIILPPTSSKILNVQTITYDKPGSMFYGEIKIEYSEKYYSIPIILSRTIHNPVINTTNNTMNVNNTQLIANITLANSYKIPMTNIDFTIKSQEIKVIDVVLINKGNKPAENITISTQLESGNIIITPKSIKIIEPSNSYPLTIEINPERNLKNNISNSLIIQYENFKYEIPITIKTIMDNLIIKNNITNNQSIQDTQVIDNLPPQVENNRTKLILAFGLIITLLFFIILYAYKKGKPKQKEFEDFVDSLRKK